MLNSIISADQHITTFLASLVPHNPVTTILFSFFSLKGSYFFVWILFLVGVLFWNRKHYLNILIFFIVGFSVAWILTNYLIKPLVRRPRPWVAEHLSTEVCPKDFSFPSGHATGAFAGAAVFAYFDRKRRFIYYPVAALIAYSRVFLYCHYLLDIIIGALIGYIMSRLTIAIIPYRRPQPES